MTEAYGVIFDMDGVLVDSYQTHYDSWRMMCGERNLVMDEHDFARTFGRTSREVIRQLWGDRITEDGMIAELDARKEALFRDLLRRDFPAMLGAVALIDRLHQGGFRLALGSSAPRENVQVVLDQLDRHEAFQVAVTGDDVSRGKPDPQVFLLAAQRLGLSADRCVVIEDAPLGITAAHAAGMRCVGFVSSGRTAAALCEADLVIDRLETLDVPGVQRLLKKGTGVFSGAGRSLERQTGSNA